MLVVVTDSSAPPLARRVTSRGRRRALRPIPGRTGPVVEPMPWRPAVRRVHPATIATVMAALVFTVVTAWLAVRAHRNFGTWGFDMGIYDQALWLVARGRSFITVRGLPVWGHHVNLVFLLLAPISWLGGGPAALVTVQALSLGAGALPVSFLTRDRLRSPWAGFAAGVAYLLYPPVGWLTWTNFHPEALSVSALLFAWWLATRRRWGWFAVAVFLALSTREEVGLQVAVMGALLLARWMFGRRGTTGARRIDGIVGALTFLTGAAWFVVCTKVVIPRYLGGGDAFYIKHFYGAYGSTMGEVVTHLATHPGTVLHLATRSDRLRFFGDMLGPLGGLPLIGLPFAFIAGPQGLATLAGSEWFLRDVRFQYTALMIPGFVIAAVEGASWLVRRWPGAVRVLAVWITLCTLTGALFRGPLPFSSQASAWVGPSSRVPALQAAVDSVPVNAGVAATEHLIPHLTHRQRAYDFPNPFMPMAYGVDGAKGADPRSVDWVVVDRKDLAPKYAAVLDRLIAPGGPFAVVSERDDVVVARRR